jgi:predicted ABC-type ATPase
MNSLLPVLVIVGGINGAGKSSVVRIMAQAEILAPATFLDPDRVTTDILAARPGISLATANFAALRFIDREIARLIGAGRSFMVETVLANHAYRRICLTAKAQGMLVRLVYIGVPTIEDAIARVALRVSKGGHDVPEADIRRRWPRTHEKPGLVRAACQCRGRVRQHLERGTETDRAGAPGQDHIAGPRYAPRRHVGASAADLISSRGTGFSRRRGGLRSGPAALRIVLGRPVAVIAVDAMLPVRAQAPLFC